MVIKMMKNKKKKISMVIILIILILFIMLIAVPYAKAEVLTYKYGDQFQELYKQTNIIADIEYLKVIEYSDKLAKVCYISKDHQSSNVITFKQQDETWVIDSWVTIWSKTGSADGFVWPYYR